MVPVVNLTHEKLPGNATQTTVQVNLTRKSRTKRAVPVNLTHTTLPANLTQKAISASLKESNKTQRQALGNHTRLLTVPVQVPGVAVLPVLAGAVSPPGCAPRALRCPFTCRNPTTSTRHGILLILAWVVLMMYIGIISCFYCSWRTRSVEPWKRY